MLKLNTEFKLPKDTFGAEINLKLLAQVNHVYTDRAHVGLRNTKTRSEINRTTKKVYKQKGTGGARHGSRRANVFVGGGVVFGPRPLHRILSLSQNVKMVSKIAAFSAKNKAKEVMVLSGLGGVVKTKEVSEFLKKLEAKRFTFLLSDTTKSSLRYLKNLKNVKALSYKQASALDILNGGTLLVDEKVFENNVEKKVKMTIKVDKTAVVKKGGKARK